MKWLKESILCLDTSSSEEWKANMVSHLRDYILAIWKVPSLIQPDTTKERLTPALLGISHNGTEENQGFTHEMLHRPKACTQQTSVQFFAGECETTAGMPVKLSETNTQHFSELSFIFFTLKLPETLWERFTRYPHWAGESDGYWWISNVRSISFSNWKYTSYPSLESKRSPNNSKTPTYIWPS